ncbi:PepSY domain-containing protein [Jeotgalibacillus malaysiensis]|uniref:PepSY domain-containing protein n=1 Tax=Jeotgalibacillus malaysiensis TaxID=1508404 RepID=UPI00384B7E01
MKKVVVGTVASAVILGGAIGAGAMTDGFQNFRSVNPAPSEPAELISVEEAKEKALAEYEGVVESIELEKKRDGYVYDIDIDNGDMDYDLDMDASNGEILRVEEERDDDDDDRDDNVTSSDSNGTAGSSNEDYISQEEAIEIALAEVEGTLESVELDDDDGRAIYEVEINTGTGDDDDAEFDIDAVTGEILEIDLD